jgi:predicted esterase
MPMFAPSVRPCEGNRNCWRALTSPAGPAPLQLAVLFVATLACTTSLAQSTSIVVLKNGIQLGPGFLGEAGSLTKVNSQRSASETPTASIISIDDDLRTTYVNRLRIDMSSTGPFNGSPPEVIELAARHDASDSLGVLAISNVLAVSKFNKHGRRTYTVDTPRGPQVLLQAITRITPLYCQVRTLRVPGSNDVRWDMRIGTSTIPPQTLREILYHELDLTKSSEWMRMVRLYIQMDRFNDARIELATAIQKFPELATFEPLLEQQTQELANQMFREVELRRQAGQPLMASQLLQNFPLEILPLETQLKVQDQAEALKQRIALVAELVRALQEDMAKLPAADAQSVAPVIEEITREISLESAARLTDYARLRADTTMTVDQHISLAIGGWLAGPGAGLDNFAITRSLARVAPLVTEYLSTADAARRQAILQAMSGEEANQPELIGKLIAHMKPPLPLPEPAPDAPNGFYQLSIPGDSIRPAPTPYVLQLPPEYDPRRLYPCVLALPGLGVPPETQVSWWCGSFDAERKTRHGLASRHGYIVISPAWGTYNQFQYNYSEAEHAQILGCLRDAMRRVSIDTDRVFVSGQQDGAAAAWDLALSHPDLWAGAVLINPTADKYIIDYRENATATPLYIVWGDKDGSGMLEKLGNTIDPYLRSNRFDCIAVEYRGRGRDHFLEELPRIMDWMELSSRRRERNPADLKFKTARTGDRFFYWLELPEIDPAQVPSPVLFKPGSRLAVEAKLLPGGNGVFIGKAPSKNVWIWVRPGMFDLSRTVEVQYGSSKKRFTVTFDTAVLLEDVRQRADRQAPFYQRLDAR